MTTAARGHLPARVLAGVVVLCLAAGALGRCAAEPAADPQEAVPVTPTATTANAQRTEQGAVDAALDILSLYGSTAMYDVSRRRELVGSTASAEVRGDLQAQLDVAFSLAARGLGVDAAGRSADGTLVARMIPAGHRVVSWSADRAVVAVWTTGLLGVAGSRSRNPVHGRPRPSPWPGRPATGAGSGSSTRTGPRRLAAPRCPRRQIRFPSPTRTSRRWAMNEQLSAAPPAAIDPCAVVPGPARIVCEAAGGVTDEVGEVVGGAAGNAADAALGGIAAAFAEAGGFFLGRLAELLSATTQVDVGAAWFIQRYALMFGLSALLTFVLLLLSVVKAVLRGQGWEAVRSGTVYYLCAVIASAFAPALVYLLVQLSDAVTGVLTFGAQEQTKTYLEETGRTLAAFSIASPGGGAATVLIASLVTIVCAVVLWVELLLRTAIIYVATLFAAPTFSGLVDRSLWRHSRRWVFFVVSVVFAKPVVVAVLGLAAAGAGAGGSADGFSSVFVALALMIVAIFCVGLLFRIIPNAGDEIAGALTARREIRAGTPNSPLPGPGVVLRQGVQSHLVRGVSGARTAGAAAARPVGGAVAAGAVAHRAATGVTRGVGSAVRTAVPTQKG